MFFLNFHYDFRFANFLHPHRTVSQTSRSKSRSRIESAGSQISRESVSEISGRSISWVSGESGETVFQDETVSVGSETNKTFTAGVAGEDKNTGLPWNTVVRE